MAYAAAHAKTLASVSNPAFAHGTTAHGRPAHPQCRITNIDQIKTRNGLRWDGYGLQQCMLQ
eukprot:9381483-Lingulodinium_polyedra.AAC.1